MNRHQAPLSRTTSPARFGERGASLVEYALLVALIAVVSISAVSALGGTTSDIIQDGADGIANAPTTTAGPTTTTVAPYPTTGPTTTIVISYPTVP